MSGGSNVYAPGVDVRADGNYIIWWPAHGYPVINDLPLDQLADWPDWLPIKRPRVVNHQRHRTDSEDSGFGPGVSFFSKMPPPRIMNHLRPAAEDALEQAVINMASSPHGAHNATLNGEVWRLRYYIREGVLTIDEVAESMAYAAKAVGHAEHRITTTLQSVFEAITRG
jgi:hypothetical protein